MSRARGRRMSQSRVTSLVEPPIYPAGGGQRRGCDSCEQWAPDDPAAAGWVVRTIRETVEWWPYGLQIGLPEQLHKGDRFTFCGHCEPLLAAGRYRDMQNQSPDFAVLIMLHGSVSAVLATEPDWPAEYAEAVAGWRRIHLNSDPTPWGDQ